MDLLIQAAWVALWGIAILTLLRLGRFFGTFMSYLRMVFVNPDYIQISEDSLPAFVGDLFDDAKAALGPLGFRTVAFVRIVPMIRVGERPSFGMLCFHHDDRAIALVEPALTPDPHNRFTVQFFSFLRDGQRVITLNGLAHLYPDWRSSTLLVDPHADTLEDEWKTHREAVGSALSSVAANPSAGQIIDIVRDDARAALWALLEEGTVRLKDEHRGELELTLRAALAYTTRTLRGSNAQHELDARRSSAVEAKPPAIAVEHEADSFLRRESTFRGGSRRLVLIWLLVFSGIAFLVSLAPFFEIRTIVILAAVVVVHELGHYLAMKVFGYEDTSIFFLPFFGAATMGRKPAASLAEEMLVLLAGPVPGILLALLLVMLNTGSFVVRELIVMLIVINLFNLLPIYPLDGGKVIQRLLFTRSPVADLLFKSLAALAFIALGFLSGSGLFIVLGALLGVSLSLGFKITKLRRAIEEAGPATEPDGPVGDEVLVARIFSAVGASSLGQLPFSRRVPIVRLLRTSLAKSSPGTGGAVVWVSTYTLCLLGGVAIAFFLFGG